ncbi:MAG: type II toxin-antitoxin system RelE/ParE family toxin [bacterium]
MVIEFDKSFSKSLDKLNNNIISGKIKKIINEIEKADSISNINNVKKLIGFQNYFRIKIGFYRLGFELRNGSTVRLLIFCHRKDIYKKFP